MKIDRKAPLHAPGGSRFRTGRARFAVTGGAALLAVLASPWAPAPALAAATDATTITTTVKIVSKPTVVAASAYATDLIARAKKLLAGKATAANAATAAALLRDAAQAGNRDAMLMLADLYNRGVGVTADPAVAIQFAQSAVAAGAGAVGWRTLGDLYRTSPAPQRDAQRAVDAYQNAVDLGDAKSSNALADMLASGDGIPADLPRAENLLWLRVKAGDPDGWRRIGDFFRDHKFDFKAAADAYHWASVNSRDPVAMVSLAAMQRLGEGVPVDLAGAKTLIQAAISGGNLAGGWLERGNYYLESPPPTRNVSLAEQAYERAIGYGEPKAMIALAGMLADGNAHDPDPARAEKLLKDAINRGETMPGWRMLAEYYVAQKRPADSADAFQHAVDLGDPLAMAGLARQLATGDGIAADPDRAEGLFWASIKAGNKAAWGPIGDFFLNTRHDFKAAADAYHWAAENGDTDATLSLALMEGQGKGLTANLSDAEALIDKAIAAGAGDKGWRAEGDLFRLSPGADPHRAVAAYAKAVDLGDRQSMISLAGMVSGGIGTAQDFASASNLLGKTVGLPANYAAALDAAEARANGNDAAAGNLALGYLYGLPQSPYFDAAKSTSYYGNAGAIGGGIGELMAAAAAAKSFDTAKARRLAIEHYQAAARFVGARQVAGDMINLPTPALVSLVQQMLVDRGQKIAVTGGIDRTTGKAMAALCEPAISCDPSVISIDAVSRLLDPS